MRTHYNLGFSNSTCLSLPEIVWFTLSYCNSSLGTKLRFTPGRVPRANRCPLLRYRTKAHHRNCPQLLPSIIFLGSSQNYRNSLQSSGTAAMVVCSMGLSSDQDGWLCGNQMWTEHNDGTPFGNFRKSRKSNLRTPRVSRKLPLISLDRRSSFVT